MKLLPVLLALCPLAFADISFTQPTASTTWTAGQTAQIQWQYVNNTSPSGPLTLNLLYGKTSFPQVLGSVTVNSGTSVSITVPTTLPSGSNYVIQTNGTSSPFFTVQNSQLPAGSPMPLNVTLAVVATNSTSAASKVLGGSAIILSGIFLNLY